MKPARYVFRCKQLKLQHNTLAVDTGGAAPKSLSPELGTCGATGLFPAQVTKISKIYESEKLQKRREASQT